MGIAPTYDEERAYGRALGKLFEHAASCRGCVPLVACPACGSCEAPEQRRECKACDGKGLKRADVDLSDPYTKLCPKGLPLRAAATEARCRLPAERLIRYWRLEEPVDVLTASEEFDDFPIRPTDEHDCARGAAWLRGDPGEARSILTRLEDKTGCKIEERDANPVALRDGFLEGFRKRFPSRGPVPDEEAKKRRAAAASRMAELAAERYEKRNGVPPPPEAIEAFRESHGLWIEGEGDCPHGCRGDLCLTCMVAKVEAFRDGHPKRWAQKALLKPKDPLAELKKIARWICDGLIEGEVSKG